MGGVWLSGLVIDRIDFAPVFIGSGAAHVVVGLTFALLPVARAAAS